MSTNHIVEILKKEIENFKTQINGASISLLQTIKARLFPDRAVNTTPLDYYRDPGESQHPPRYPSFAPEHPSPLESVC